MKEDAAGQTKLEIGVYLQLCKMLFKAMMRG